MAITYKPLRILVKEVGYTLSRLREPPPIGLSLSSITTTRLNKDDPVSLEVIDRICAFFDVEIQDVVAYLPGEFKPGPQRYRPSYVTKEYGVHPKKEDSI